MIIIAYADKIFKDNLRNVLENGVWDTGYNVRPRWEDNSPAHTKYITHVVNTYDIAKDGLPITTLRRVAWKTALNEIRWIYQNKTDDVQLLKDKYNVHYWDEWTDENMTLNGSYGHQLGKVSEYPEITSDQVDRILYLLKNDKMNRRMITNMFTMEEVGQFTLAPCAFMCMFSVRDGYLDMMLVQRSQDAIAANSINVVSYAFLQMMFAQSSGLKTGKLTHIINNFHIYDRHIEIAKELLQREEYSAPTLWINPEITDFYQFTDKDFKLINYQHGEPIKNIPIAI